MSIYIINAFISLFLLLAYGVICVCLGFVAQKWHTQITPYANKRNKEIKALII